MKYFVLKDKSDPTKFFVLIRNKYTLIYQSPKSMSIFQAQKLIFEIENCIVPVQIKPVIESDDPLSERLKYSDIIAMTVQLPPEYIEERIGRMTPSDSRKQLLNQDSIDEDHSNLFDVSQKQLQGLDDPLLSIVPNNSRADTPYKPDDEKPIEIDTEDNKPKVRRISFKRRKSASVIPKG